MLLSGVDRGAEAASGGAEAAVVSAAAKPAFGAKDLPGTWRGKLVSKDGTRTAAEMGVWRDGSGLRLRIHMFARFWYAFDAAPTLDRGVFKGRLYDHRANAGSLRLEVNRSGQLAGTIKYLDYRDRQQVGTLRLTLQADDDPDDTMAEARKLGVLPATRVIGGELDRGKDVDVYSFKGVRGGAVAVDVQGLGALQDEVKAVVYRPNGRRVRPGEHGVPLHATGFFYVAVSSLLNSAWVGEGIFDRPGGESGAYELILRDLRLPAERIVSLAGPTIVPTADQVITGTIESWNDVRVFAFKPAPGKEILFQITGAGAASFGADGRFDVYDGGQSYSEGPAYVAVFHPDNRAFVTRRVFEDDEATFELPVAFELRIVFLRG